MTCELCGENVYTLFPMLYSDGEKLMICRKCLDFEEIRADVEYENQKEQENNNG